MPGKRYVGSTEVLRRYLGSTLIYEASSGEETSPEPVSDDLGITRTAQITSNSGGRDITVPQSWIDRIAADAAANPDTMTVGTPTTSSVQDGDWSSASTWDNGVPGAGDVVSISHDVTYDRDSNDHITDVIVEMGGVLRMSRTVETKLVVDTIFAKMGSEIDFGSADSVIPRSATPGKPFCDIVFKRAQTPGASPRLGLMTMGKARIYGAPVLSHVSASGGINSGATTFTTSDALASWRVGDTVIVASTDWRSPSTSDSDYDGPSTYWSDYTEDSSYEKPYPAWKDRVFARSHDEIRTITAIDTGTGTVTLDAGLSHDHPSYSRTLPRGQTLTVEPRVCNLSRSIRFSTESSDLSDVQNRAHIMFMNDDTEAWYAEAKNMGRTKSDPTLTVNSDQTDNKLYDDDPDAGGQPLADPQNVRGRYAWHIHRTGPFFAKKQVNFIGLTAWAPTDEVPMPGWGIVHHGSRAAVERCVVYNVRGAGMVSELGNEIGQWLDNTVLWARGDGFEMRWGRREEKITNHHGHAGVGYENQARQVLLQRNWAGSCVYGYTYFQQNTNENIARVADGNSLRLRDPVTQGGKKDIVSYAGVYFDVDDDTYGIEQPQIPDWHDQVASSCVFGFFVAHRQFADRADMTPMISKRYCAIACNNAFWLENYTYHYWFYDFMFIGNGTYDQGATEFRTNKAMSISFINGRIESFRRIGLMWGLNYGGFFIDVDRDDLQNGNDLSDYSIDSFGYTPENADVWNVMGPSSNSGGSWKPRIGEIYDSSTDLPLPYPNAPLGIDANTTVPAGAKPMFVLDGDSDLGIYEDQTDTMSYSGVIFDSVGIRRYPDVYMYAPTYSNSDSTEAHETRRENYNATGADIVRRNGCFEDSPGNWKTRAWHVDVDRETGDYFTFYVDLDLAGSWDSQFLADHTVDPNETEPQLPLVPEALHGGPVSTPDPLPALPTGYRRPGSFELGYSGEMILPDWVGGAGTQFNPSQVDFKADGSVELTFESKDLSGEIQVIDPKRGSGKWGWISRSTQAQAVLAMFVYAQDGTEVDFEYRGDGVWQMNLHLGYTAGGHATPVTPPTFAMDASTLAEWHKYEFELTGSAAIFYIDEVEVARIEPSDFSASVVWKTDADLEMFTSIEWHEAWAKWDDYGVSTFEVAALLV